MNSDPFEASRKRVEQFPENELFRFSLGKALFDAGNYQEAIQHFEIAFHKKSDWMAIAILLGRAYKSIGDMEKARAYLETGQKLAREQNHEGPWEETKALLAEL
jgi:uncharacterized protein HemY